MKRAAYIVLAVTTVVAFALGFGREAFGKRHCYTLEAFRYRQATLFGIPVYRKRAIVGRRCWFMEGNRKVAEAFITEQIGLSELPKK